VGCSYATDVNIRTLQPLDVLLECEGDKVILTAFNKFDDKVNIEKGVLGIDNTFAWNPYVVLKRRNYTEAFVEGRNWLIDKYRVKPTNKVKQESELKTFEGKETLQFDIQLNNGYTLEQNSEYVVFLAYPAYMTKINGKSVELAVFSNKIIMNGRDCAAFN
jgi:hypothetical protein